MRSMNEETTRDLKDNHSFEERVFARFDAMESRFTARFDAIDARLDTVDMRLDAVEVRLEDLDRRVQTLEAQAYDTKPIWERALAEILSVKERLDSIERKFDVLTLDMMSLRGEQRRLEGRFASLESKPA